VQQAIASIQNAEQLKAFLRQLAQAADEQEVAALLTRSFPASKAEEH
jgi:hypothetical protein